jgi:hypothetical protein
MVRIGLLAMVCVPGAMRTSSASPLFGAPQFYDTAYMPKFVAVADVNGDGKLDMVTANEPASWLTYPGTVSVLLGVGDGTFAPRLDFLTGGVPNSVAIGDMNGDGRPDLVTTNSGGILLPVHPPTISILLGNGDGTFGPALNTGTADVANSAAIRDLNGDGKPDVVAVYAGGGGLVLPGDGSGGLGTALPFAAGSATSFPHSLTLGDLNGDGKPDLVVSCLYAGPSVLIGNGDGTFGGPAAAGSGSFAAALGDLNADGKLDLAAASYFGDAVLVSLGNGNGTFGPQTSYPTGVRPDSIRIADFDGDGRLDVATSNAGSISILLGNGDGTLAASSEYAVAGPIASTLAVGDMNGDGKRDLATALPYGISYNSNNKVTVLLNIGSAPSAVDARGEGATFGLLAPAPNPARTLTTIAFELAEPGSVTLDVLDVTGRVIRTLASGMPSPGGRHTARWDATDGTGRHAAPGIYLVRLRTSAHQSTRPVVILE